MTPTSAIVEVMSMLCTDEMEGMLRYLQGELRTCEKLHAAVCTMMKEGSRCL